MPDAPTLKTLAETIAIIIGAVVAFMVPFLAWLKEERTHREQRDAAKLAAQSARLAPGGLTQPTAALYVDQASIDRITLLGERMILACERLVVALAKTEDAVTKASEDDE